MKKVLMRSANNRPKAVELDDVEVYVKHIFDDHRDSGLDNDEAMELIRKLRVFDELTLEFLGWLVGAW